MKCIRFDKEEKYIKAFIDLSKKLYTKKDNMEDPNTMLNLLLGKHPLSSYFNLTKFLIYKDDEALGRFIITEYPNDKKICYIGFFECINDKKVAKFLFKKAYEYAKEKKYKKIIGPVDASFWIKYRLKINLFNKRPYTGEPYNLNYYYKFFLDNQYRVIEHYVSNAFQSIDETYYNTKFIKHFKEFEKLGYKIIKPDLKDFDKCMEEVYILIMDLYSDFPTFKSLTKEDFMEVFKSYKTILNMNMVRMAYYKNHAVGFCISIPNYNNLVYHINYKTIPKIIWRKNHPKEYIMLYLGVDRNHKGLGKAIAYSISEELKKNKLPSINALIRDGKVNLKYGEEVIEGQYEYVLLERIIK